jgi:hypothetical protein
VPHRHKRIGDGDSQPAGQMIVATSAKRNASSFAERG